MGKYSKVVETLPDLPPKDPSYQEKVNTVKTAITAAETHTPESLAKAYKHLRRGHEYDIHASEAKDFVESIIDLLGKDGIEDVLHEVNLRIEAHEQLLIASCDSDEPGWGLYGAGPTTVRLSSGESVSVQYEPEGKVEDKEVFRQWCIANGYENSLQLWPSTMNAITKERILEGKDAPAGVRAYSRSKLTLRKAGSKE